MQRSVPETLTVYTWGHSRERTFEDLLAALRLTWPEPWRVPIVDVRRSRGSRNPRWHCDGTVRTQLVYLWYVWLNGLGNAQSAPSGTWVPARGDAVMEQHLDYAASLLRRYGAVVLVCAERDHRKCHRVQVAEALAERTGAEVVHL
jgi:uncharacterized protein (DUF488 family)